LHQVDQDFPDEMRISGASPIQVCTQVIWSGNRQELVYVRFTFVYIQKWQIDHHRVIDLAYLVEIITGQHYHHPFLHQ
jgi:hypothetical protein